MGKRTIPQSRLCRQVDFRRSLAGLPTKAPPIAPPAQGAELYTNSVTERTALPRFSRYQLIRSASCIVRLWSIASVA